MTKRRRRSEPRRIRSEENARAATPPGGEALGGTADRNGPYWLVYARPHAEPGDRPPVLHEDGSYR